MSISIKDLNFSIKGSSKSRTQNKQLLKGVNASVETAKLVGIIGPNGAGKSTLLNCLSGLLNSKESIQLNNRWLESYTHKDLAKVRAALPQASNLSFPFIAKDIVGMSFALSAISIQQQYKLINYCLDMMSASDLAMRNYLSLSGGEKQRIQLARVLAQLLQNDSKEQMRLLLLDEPTAPLDLKYQFQLFRHLKQFVKQNITTITVIHDINLAAAYCDEIWVMQDGQLISQDKPQQVISNTMMKKVFDVDVNIAFHQNQLLPIISNPI